MRGQSDGIGAFLATRDFLLEFAALARRDLDPVDNLILLGVSQANVRQIVASRESQLRYAYAETNPPDDIRKPIRIAALSRALALPFETVRRRTIRLGEAGELVTTSTGLRVPAAKFDTPQHLAGLKLIDERVERAFDHLASGGFFDAEALSAPRAVLYRPPVRAVGRLAGDFYLRMLAPLRTWAGDPMDASILLCASRLTGADDASGGNASRRSSAGAAQIAAELGYASETVRRRLQQLTQRGLCQRVARGMAIPRETLEQTLLPTFAGPNEMNLRRLFRQLAELGAVHRWRPDPAVQLSAAPSHLEYVRRYSGVRAR